MAERNDSSCGSFPGKKPVVVYDCYFCFSVVEENGGIRKE